MDSHRARLLLVGSVFFFVAHGCGGGGGASPSELAVSDVAGVYDASVDRVVHAGAATSAGDAAQSSAAIATMGGIDGGGLALAIYDRGLSAIRLTGTLQPDGSVDLQGEEQEGNLLAFAHGTATIVQKGESQTVTGSLELADGTHAFTLERPLGRTLSRYTGTYTFAFPVSPSLCQCPSSAIMELRFADDGSGGALGASEVDGSGHGLGTFQGASAIVSASGRLAIFDTYNERNTPSDLWLFGHVTRNGEHVAGSGEFNRRGNPIAIGAWSAIR